VVADQSGRVIRVDCGSGFMSTVSSVGLGLPVGIAVEDDGDLIVADGADRILRLDPVTGAATVITDLDACPTLNDPWGVEIDANGDILVAVDDAFLGNVDLDGGVLRVDPDTGGCSTLCDGTNLFPEVLDLVLRSDGVIFATDLNRGGDPGSVVRCPTGSPVVASGSPIQRPFAVALDHQGDLVVADVDAFGGNGGVIRVDPATGATTPLASGGSFVDPGGIAVVADSTLVIDPGGGLVAASLLGGSSTPGGLEVEIEVTEGSALVAGYEPLTPQALTDCVLSDECPPPDYAIPGDIFQLWEILFQGVLDGLARLVFRYDEGALAPGTDEAMLDVYHFEAGRWQRLAALERDVLANTITVEVDAFSPFALGLLPACQDGRDNDGDGWIDHPDDPNCTGTDDASEVPDCADGINNDEDGDVDFGGDVACLSASDESEDEPGISCDDGLDDDGDGFVDYRLDHGCRDALYAREDPACDDDLDNDGDGTTDWDGGTGGGAPDPQCTGQPWKNKERSGGCGLGGEMALVVSLMAALRRWSARRSRMIARRPHPFLRRGQLGGLVFAALFAVADPKVATARTGHRSVTAAPYPSATFEVNQGQTDARVKFLSRRGAATLYLLEDEFLLAFHEPVGRGGREALAPRAEGSVLRTRLLGSRPSARWRGLDRLPARSHYYRSGDPSTWITGVPHFRSVRLEGVYPGVDLVFRVEGERLEYDFELAPGTDPRAIRLGFEGAKRVEIDARGDLVMELGAGELRQPRPRIYRTEGTSRHDVDGGWRLIGEGEVGFRIAEHDPESRLVIDPVLVYSRYLGGSLHDTPGGGGIAVDTAGNVYVTGRTQSADFDPVANAIQATLDGTDDVFVTKLDPNTSPPTVVYSTFLGGSDADGASAIAVDASGNAYVGGGTFSDDFPVLNAFDSTKEGGAGVPMNAFVTKLDSSGSLVYSTYLTGSQGAEIHCMAVDSAQSVYASGYTGAGFPTTPGVFQESDPDPGGGDAFVTKFAPSGASLVYSTYLGGPDDGNCSPGGMAVDAGRVYLAGRTHSTGYPVQNPFQASNAGPPDAFVTALDETGSTLVYSSYLGGNDYDQAFNVAVVNGTMYVVGTTSSADFPLASPYQSVRKGVADAFLTIVSPTGALSYSTFFGGSDTEWAYGVGVDALGAVYLGGLTTSMDFPLVNPIQGRDENDAYVAKLDVGANELLYSTTLGGSGSDAIYDLFVDPSDTTGTVYAFGETQSSDLPTRGTAGSAPGGTADTFVVILDPDDEVTLRPGDALVASQVGTRVPELVLVDPATGAQAVARQWLGAPWSALALDGEGRFFVAREGATPADLLRVDAASGLAATLAASGLAQPRAIAIEASGAILVADEGAATLSRVPATGGAPVVLSSGFGDGPRGLALEPDGDILVLDGADIVGVDPSSGSRTAVCAGVGSAPSALALGETGEVFVIDADEILGIVPGPCTERLVTSAQNLVAPVDLAVEASGGLLVVDAGSGGGAFVVRVDADGGMQTLLPPMGGELVAPSGIAIVPQSVVVVHPGDDPVSVPMLEGLGTPGGLEVTLDASQGGPLTAEYDQKTPQELTDCTLTGSCPPLDYAIPGDSFQLWEIAFQGILDGLARLVFRYDPTALLPGTDEAKLHVYHFRDGRWNRLAAIARDLVAKTITVDVDAFSPFALGLLPACQDGVDNESPGDGLVDYPADPGCRDAEDPSEVPDCQDGINDDFDGLVDFPADPGCASATDGSELHHDPVRVCDDGLDNDGDGRFDFRLDPGCRDALWTRENPQCDDDLDNDGDEGIDWDGGPAQGTPDPQCVSAAWRGKERSGGCGLGGELVVLGLLARRIGRSTPPRTATRTSSPKYTFGARATQRPRGPGP
jgi:streptogramin lyase